MYQIKHTSIVKFTSVLVIIGSLALMQGCDEAPIEEKQKIRAIKAMEIIDAGQLSQRAFPGIAKATQEVNLAFRIAGPLVEYPVLIGDKVTKGDVVARVDPRDYQVEVNNAKAQVARAQASFKRAAADYKREMNILSEDAGATSQAAVDRKEAQRNQTSAEVRSAQAVLSSASDNLSYTYLHAPFDGVVVDTYVKNFENIRAKQQIVRIVDNSKIEMVVDIPEALISLVPEATNIVVVFDNFPTKKIPAEIKEIGTEASRSTRTYPVNLIMEQPSDIQILPGMAGKVTADPPADGNKLESKGKQVPLTAIFSPDDIDKTYVWIIDQKTKLVSKREVSTGLVTKSGILITEGIKTGEWIATAGVHYLHDGMEVKILGKGKE